MELNPIGKLISESRMGTRIPEEMLGLPARGERYTRTYSMDPVESVSNVRRSVQPAAGENETASSAGNTTDKISATEAAASIASLIGNETGTANVAAFHDVLQQAIAERQTPTLSKELASDPEYYRNLMILSQFSSNLISNNLNTLGASGASVFGLDGTSGLL